MNMQKSKYISNIFHEVKFRLKMRNLNLDTCILVHQMGKVGSSAIVKSLESLHLENPVFHTHSLNSEELSKRIRKHKASSVHSGNMFVKGHLRTSKTLSNILRKRSKIKKWKIITLVREPIGRNISAFFQNFDDFTSQDSNDFLSNDQIAERFFDKDFHSEPLDWLDLEIKNVFGIDIYQDEFPRDTGYKIYSIDSKFDLMIIRLEDLNQCHKKAFKEFLGIEDFTLSNKNRASDKNYSNTYRSFINDLSIPSWYIDEMYSSKYCKHFYSDSEIEKFRQKWLNNGKG